MERDDILPEWLLWEILIRLPPKCVLRCKLVSKQWASLISNPLFVGSYQQRSSSSSSRSWTIVAEGMIHYRGNKELSFVQVKLPEEDVIWSREDFRRLRGVPNIEAWLDYKVFGASNGLILVGMINDLGNGHYISRNTYFLCNPFTGESLSLPPPQTEPESLLVDDDQYWGPIGLLTRVGNNNTVLESYRVVLSLPQTGGRLRFGVYASESQAWKEFVLPPSEQIERVVPATLDNRILHWVTTDGSVIAYDPDDDRVRIIAPPPRDDNNNNNEEEEEFIARMCDASEGELRYFEYFLPSLRFKLWVLKPSGWSLSRESSIRADHRMLDPMFFNPSDTDMLYLADEHGLVSFHVKTGELEVVLHYNTGQRSSCYPLYPRDNAFLVQVSPCWPVSLQRS